MRARTPTPRPRSFHNFSLFRCYRVSTLADYFRLIDLKSKISRIAEPRSIRFPQRGNCFVYRVRLDSIQMRLRSY